MKSKKHILISLAVSIVLLVAMVVGTQVTVSAAVAGSTYGNPVVLSNGTWKTKTWTSDNDHLNYYSKITVPSRGYITIDIEKPVDTEGEYGSFYVSLYSQSGKLAWETNTSEQKDTFTEYYRYKVGLAAGTYYMNLDPSFYLYSDSAPISHRYRYQYTKASNWEIEPNNNMSAATEIAVGKTYYGVYTEESYNTVYKDYFKVKLTKGCKYAWTIGNYAELDAGTLITCIYDANGEKIGYSYGNLRGREVGNSYVESFTAPISGWYYLVFDNDGNSAGVDYTVRIDRETIPISKLKVSISSSSYTYNGKVRVPTVTVKDADGKTISSSNYTVTKVTDCKNVGTHKIKVAMKGAYSGSQTLTYKIKAVNISKCSVKLSTTNYTYDAKVKAPSVIVKNASGTTLKKGTHYTVTYSGDRKKVGTYKVTVKMKGNYTGTKTLTFKIIPAKTAITKMTISGSTAKVYWKAKTSQATGYQVQYASSSKFTSVKSKTITSYKTSSAALSGISLNSTKYIRIRTYKTVNGVKYYSLWKTYKYSKGKLAEI